MALKNYRVEQTDGETTFYQFDDDEVGKASLEALRDAAKDKNSGVKSVREGDPEPFNTAAA